MEATYRPLTPLSIAFWCAAVPFGLGCGVFLLWSATQWEWLPAVGLLNVAAGVLSFLVGAGFLFIHFLEVSRSRPTNRVGMILGFAVGALLVLNFPAAAAIVNAVIRLEGIFGAENLLEQSSVRIVNATDTEVTTFTMSGTGITTKFPPIAARDGRSTYFVPDPGAELKFMVEHEGQPNEATARAPENGTGTVDVVVVIDPDGKLQVTSLTPQIVWFED